MHRTKDNKASSLQTEREEMRRENKLQPEKDTNAKIVTGNPHAGFCFRFLDLQFRFSMRLH